VTRSQLQQANTVFNSRKQRGFGLSYFLMAIVASMFAFSLLQVFSNESRYQVKEKEVLSSRINAIADVTRIYYASHCTFGVISEGDLEPLNYGNILDLNSFGIDDVVVEIKSVPRPFIEMNLELASSNPLLIDSLIFTNGNVSASGLDVTIKLPLNFSSSSQGAFLHQDRQRNDNQVCS